MTKKHEARTILVIEDEIGVQNFVSRVLELEGFHVLRAGDGDAGIRMAAENPVALVVLDLRLPGRDGWSVLEELRSQTALSAIPVVVLTALAGAVSRQQALGKGSADYLVKPLSAAHLRKTVARILRLGGEC